MCSAGVALEVAVRVLTFNSHVFHGHRVFVDLQVHTDRMVDRDARSSPKGYLSVRRVDCINADCIGDLGNVPRTWAVVGFVLYLLAYVPCYGYGPPREVCVMVGSGTVHSTKIVRDRNGGTIRYETMINGRTGRGWHKTDP
jgi:hypothetical protein